MLKRLSETDIDAVTRGRLVGSVLVLTLIGLGLRLSSARGDLWLDEIWSLRSLEHLHSAGEIFWGLPFDNNHVLNSLWLWIVGPQAPPVLIRLESIIAGTLTIPIAAKFCGRAGPVAAITAAAIVTSALVFVQFGSEARGYAGLLLMIFVAADALEDFIEVPTASARYCFAGAVALGCFFHLTMVFDAGVLVAATLLRLQQRGEPKRELLSAGFDLIFAVLLGALPAVGLFVISALMHTLHLGTSTPFTVTGLAESLTQIYAATLGLPYVSLAMAVLIAVAVTIAAVIYVGRERAILPLTCILLPVLVAIALRTPNVQYARFFLIGAVGLVVLASDVAEKLWNQRRYRTLLSLGLLAIIGNAFHLQQLVMLGRGNIQPLVARMEVTGPTTFASNLPPETWVSLHFYDRKNELREVQPNDWCDHPPDWYVLTDRPALESPTLTFGAPTCRVRYVSDTIIRRAPLSGLCYALYRRVTP